MGAWKRFQKVRANLDDIHQWYGSKGTSPLTGLGLICGKVSGNLELFEFDGGGRAYEPFKAAARRAGLGPLIDRLEAGYAERTPTGGRHLFYRCEAVSGNTTLAEYQSEDEIDGRGKPVIKPLIETRGEGGYVITAPSHGSVHPNKGRYELLSGSLATIPTITPEERDELFDLARSFDQLPRIPPSDPHPASDPHPSGNSSGSRPGDDFNARATWQAVLEPHGWKAVGKGPDGETNWRRPGKSLGVSATTGHCGDWFYPFTTSSAFEAGRTYTKYGAYTILNHGGDYRAAAKALRLDGYGSVQTPPAPGPRAREGTPKPSSNGDDHGGERHAADGSAQEFPLTDLGNAERLVSRDGRDLRFVHPWGKWLHWDGRRWAIDQEGHVRTLAKRTIREIYLEAARCTDDARRIEIAKWAKQSEDARKISAMIKLAESEDGIPVLPARLNQYPYLLNCQNGTLDLRSGHLGPHNRGELITHLCPVEYDPTADCPDWKATLELVFDGKSELIDYFQMLCGLCLTGDVSEQYLPILHGKGSNGKSTLVNALLGMLGPDYAMKSPQNFLMVKRNETHPTELADLFGKRLVVAIETGEGCRINEVLVKELTGSDPIRARRMREDFWQFDPTHKLMLCTNHRPTVRGTDHAIWRRLKLVPFTVTIPAERAVTDMPRRLEAEYPGILAWCMRGCLKWRELGRLLAPREVEDATEDYRQQEDTIGGFLAEHCLVGPSYRARASMLYARYRSVAERSGEVVVSQTRFGCMLTERGFERLANNGIWYLGLGLRSDGSDPFD